ncbi:hypothetical protein EVAR_30505_1 [Eumeta japonica]|uniref:Uncharacterized protein n=1 Tax=Eumeta variegata TaxID=151549 RepID=A0A4C1VXX7_EUMVA|nr:hypothetical protein EVAR_30505_1 [Eumeta japonica]
MQRTLKDLELGHRIALVNYQNGVTSHSKTTLLTILLPSLRYRGDRRTDTKILCGECEKRTGVRWRGAKTLKSDEALPAPLNTGHVCGATCRCLSCLTHVNLDIKITYFTPQAIRKVLEAVEVQAAPYGIMAGIAAAAKI